MPKYDLAGNPLPEPGGTSAPQSAPPPGQAMPRPAAQPPYGIPPAYTPPSSDAPVRRDLAGNALPASAPPPPPPGGPMPGPMPGRMPQPGTWPPPPTGGPQPAYEMSPVQNDSGRKAGVPPEIAALKWNWGAFWLTWLWCLNHGLIVWGIGILVGGIALGFIPGGRFLLLTANIYFGIMGHKLAGRTATLQAAFPSSSRYKGPG